MCARVVMLPSLGCRARELCLGRFASADVNHRRGSSIPPYQQRFRRLQQLPVSQPASNPRPASRSRPLAAQAVAVR
jgi:hypothetical protein